MSSMILFREENDAEFDADVARREQLDELRARWEAEAIPGRVS